MVQFNIANVTNVIKSALKPQHYRTFFNGFSLKRTYNSHKVIGYTQKQLYDVISDVDEYKKFIPYCTSSEVLKIQKINNRNKKLTAVLGIGFNGYSETYISEVTCEIPGLVRAESSPDDIFKHLLAVWEITPHHKLSTHCDLKFHLEFEFSSLLYSQLVNIFFDEITILMIDSFESRCNKLYGPPAPSI